MMFCFHKHFTDLDYLETYDHWSVAVLTVTVHSSFFSHFWFFFKYVAFCTGFNLLTPIFMLPYIIMDLPIFDWFSSYERFCEPRYF